MHEFSVEDQRLIGYFVARDDQKFSLTGLEQHLSRRLPVYMIPSALIPLDQIPLTINGKLDRAALPTLKTARPELASNFVAPNSPLEKSIAAIWCEVLKLDCVGVRDPFFALGGHSLLAMSLVARITQLLRREIPVRWVFENPTIERFARKLEETTNRTEQSLAIPLADRQQPLPLSFGQHAMWLVQAMLPDHATYHQPIAFRISGQVDRVLVDCALDQIIERHESLRTALIQSDDTLVQRISPPDQALVNRREIRLDLQAGDTEKQTLQAVMLEEVRRPFDLAVAPLWRVLWMELSNDAPILLITFHHSIIDEWSMRLFSHELTELYSAMVLQRPADLPVLPIQYADFASWQRSRQSSAEWEQSLVYWKEQLNDLPPALELPTDQVRPLHPSGRGAIHEFRISGAVTGQLRQLAQQESTTLFSLLLATFHVWLARHTGQTDIIVGTPLANRTRPEVQSLIGYFLNTLPIRARLDANPSFRQVLRQVHQTFWDAYTHAEIPFEQLVELAVTEREFGRQPTYQVMFVLLEEGVENLKFGDATGLPFSIETETSKSDLTLDIQAIGEDWICRLEYATDLFSAQSMERMAEHFQVLINGIATNPDTAINHLPLLTAREQQQILIDWNQTFQEYPRDQTVHHRFEEQVQRTPQAIAVEFGELSLTYDELNRQANQLAWHLRDLGVCPENRIGISVERSFNMIIGLLAILKTGCAYVPLDHHYPNERLAYLVTDTAVSLILTDSHLASRWKTFNTPLVILDQNAATWNHAPTENPPQAASATSLAYLIYTSGSTGTPKGVEVLHRGIVRLVCSTNYVDLDETQSVLQLAVLSFDASTFEIWGPLLNGARCVLAPDQLPDLEELCRLIHQKQIRTLWLTSTLFNTIVDSQLTALEGIEQLLVGGEALSVTHIRRAQQKLGSRTQLINGYGPTESTTFACCFRIPPDVSDEIQSIPIGKPIANTTAYILNTYGTPVPIGVVGELHLGGDGLARGYRNSKEFTAERFIPDPFSNRADARLYRTGDLVRWQADGNIEFLGRRDQQIKLRGFRVELGEIEAALLRQTDIQQAVVLLREDHPGDKRLVAYLVVKPTAETEIVHQIRVSLQEQLPEYLIPSAFFILDAIPLTPNGKVDKPSLPRPETKQSNHEWTFAPPRTPLEELIASSWCNTLKLERVSIDDNFFELGGHSLLAIRVVDAIKRSSGKTIKVADLFRYATVAELARLLSDPLQADDNASFGTYLESIRPGQHPVNLVIVGAKLRVPLETLSANIPVWWLKLDGLHVWPPQHLDIPTQAAAQVQELLVAIPTGTILLCGHSYGGLLAIEIVNQIRKLAHRSVELVLLEPSMPSNCRKSKVEQLARKLNDLRHPGRLNHLRTLVRGAYKSIQGKLHRTKINKPEFDESMISADDRWRFMSSSLMQHIRVFQLDEPLAEEIHLIKTRDYDEATVEELSRMTTFPLQIFTVAEHLNHLDIAKPQQSAAWMSLIRHLIDWHMAASPTST